MVAIRVDRQAVAIRVLEILNEADGAVDTIQAQQELLKEVLGVDAVGIRLWHDGDYPFYAATGFSPGFLAVESTLCSYDLEGRRRNDADGGPVLECVCGAVLRGELSSEASFRSPGGSFWVNRSSQFAVETPPGHMPARVRLTCVQEGYETMAVLPLRSGRDVVGLLQINDRRPDLLDADLIGFLEGLANSIGVGVGRERAREALAATNRLVLKTRDELEATLDALRLGIVRLDVSGRIIFLNCAVEAFCGLAREDLVGKHYSDLCFVDARVDRFVSSHLDCPEQQSERRMRVETRGRGDIAYRLDLEVRRDQVMTQDTLLLLYDVTEVTALRRQLDHHQRFHDLVGSSKSMTSLFRRIQEVAAVDFTVLVEGETGTGKELVARAIHAASNRSDGPFVPVNCAGLTETLLASQLFGHKRGSFTGAVADHKGYFEAAAGGTLFLDEIGDISAGLQAMLLRVLEEKRVTRVGDTVERPLDLRIVAATHHDLAEDARVGRFRSDLLYRLRVARLVLPPLTSRKEDIPLLVGHFLRRFRTATGKDCREISDSAMRLLLDHPWPGNVRELKAAIEFASLHSVGPVVDAEDLPPEIRGEGQFAMPVLPSSIFEADSTPPPADGKEALLAALKAVDGNRTRAARRLGMSRATFYRRLSEYGLDSK